MIGFEIRKAENSNNFYWEFDMLTGTIQEVWDKFRANFEGYETLTVYLEDVILVACFFEHEVGVKHYVTCFDTMRGKVEKAAWTTEQLLAVVRVAFCGEEPEFNTAEMKAAQELAEPLFEGWDNACRPIP